MLTDKKTGRPAKEPSPPPAQQRIETVFGEPRNFFDNRFIYLVVSQRARGLSLGVNMNPDQNCNFRCVYCEVKRDPEVREARVNVRVMTAELRKVLTWVRERTLCELPSYRAVPEELLHLKGVALSGNGEPTLCPNFSEVVQALVHLRALAQHPFFKITLITNATGLHLPEVRQGLEWLAAQDEVWGKLDAGTQAYMDKVNRTQVPLERVLENLLALGRQRPLVIQSLFPVLHGQEPPPEEIEQYVRRLGELQAGGAMISQVQVYSAHRPTALPECSHASLSCLSRIAHRIREVTGLPAEVF